MTEVRKTDRKWHCPDCDVEMSSWVFNGKTYGGDPQNFTVSFGPGKAVLISVQSDYCLSCIAKKYNAAISALTQEERETIWIKIIEAFDPVFPKIGVRIDTFGSI